MSHARCINCKHLILNNTDIAQSVLTQDPYIYIRYWCDCKYGDPLTQYKTNILGIKKWGPQKKQTPNQKHRYYMNEKRCDYTRKKMP